MSDIPENIDMTFTYPRCTCVCHELDGYDCTCPEYDAVNCATIQLDELNEVVARHSDTHREAHPRQPRREESAGAHLRVRRS